MNQILVFKTRLRANSNHSQAISSNIGASRFAYNSLLNWAVEQNKLHQVNPAHPRPVVTQSALQKTWVHTLRDSLAPWHRDNSSLAYCSGVAALAKAYQGFFAGTTKHPVFKTKGGREAYSFAGMHTSLRSKGSLVQIPRVGLVPTYERLKAADWLQRMGSTLQEVTVSREPSGHYFASLRYRVPDRVAFAFFRGKLFRRGSGFVGVDLGLRQYAYSSNEEIIANPRYYRKLEKKLARAQRSLAVKKLEARKQSRQSRENQRDSSEPSKSHERARIKAASIHESIRNQRREFLNKTARALIASNSTVVIEDLDVQAMKSKFGKSVSDASPAEFRRILTYMAERYGTQVIVADRYFPSSKTCSSCGTVKSKLSLSERQYDCSVCGLSLDRDFNAALNLEAWGRKYLTQQAAAGYAEAQIGRGPKDLMALDQSRHKPPSESLNGKASQDCKV